jgi:hypothetical protein
MAIIELPENLDPLCKTNLHNQDFIASSFSD